MKRSLLKSYCNIASLIGFEVLQYSCESKQANTTNSKAVSPPRAKLSGAYADNKRKEERGIRSLISTSQNVLKLILKSTRFVLFGANVTKFGC